MFEKDKIRDLLGAGLDVTVVASAVGCSVSYVSNLMADEDFAREVAEIKVTRLQSAAKRDEKFNSIEDSLLDRLTELIKSPAFTFTKPREILSALAVVNKAVRRGPAVDHSAENNSGIVVQITLPERVASKLVMNAQGEVVALDDQTLVTMPSNQLLKSFAAEDKENASKIRRFAASTLSHKTTELDPDVGSF